MSNLVEHAKRELAFMKDGDEMNEAMHDHLLHMVEEFAKEEHSGFSASYAASALNKLFQFEPLRPLQGTDDEWNEVAEGLLQNKRCGRIFKDKSTGRAYDIEGKVFIDPYGSGYTSSDSCIDITFPYTPKTEYVTEKELRNEK